MPRYIQRISLLGKERWIGWEVDGVGTDIPGLVAADAMTEDELRARGIKEFQPLPFEQLLGIGGVVAGSSAGDLLARDVEFRLDALEVGLERYRKEGLTDVPRAFLATVFGGDGHIDDARIQARFRAWEAAGAVRIVGEEACYLRIVGRLA